MDEIIINNLKFPLIQREYQDLKNRNTDNRKKIEENEDLIDKLNDGIIKHITQYLPHESNARTGKRYGSYITISNNVERISDHCSNIGIHIIQRIRNVELNTHSLMNEIHSGNQTFQLIVGSFFV